MSPRRRRSARIEHHRAARSRSAPRPQSRQPHAVGAWALAARALRSPHELHRSFLGRRRSPHERDPAPLGRLRSRPERCLGAVGVGPARSRPNAERDRAEHGEASSRSRGAPSPAGWTPTRHTPTDSLAQHPTPDTRPTPPPNTRHTRPTAPPDTRHTRPTAPPDTRHTRPTAPPDTPDASATALPRGVTTRVVPSDARGDPRCAEPRAFSRPPHRRAWRPRRAALRGHERPKRSRTRSPARSIHRRGSSSRHRCPAGRCRSSPCRRGLDPSPDPPGGRHAGARQ